LPNPSLITEAAKTAYMISISSRGNCGEDDFRCPFLKKVSLPAEGWFGYKVLRIS
jgi:hypothetical protein